MSGWERGAAGSSRHHNPASGSVQPGGYTTPSARAYGANDGGIRRSFLPRPSGLGGAGEGSVKQKASTGASAGRVPLRRRSSVDDMALRARLSAAGRSGNLRISGIGGAGASGAGAPSAAMLKTTPVRNVLSVVNYAPTLSAQSKRLSSQSRQSNAGRHKRKDVRPMNETAFKKRCIDNILNFLVDNNYCNQDSSLLNRRVIASPTNKDFANIFSFIYGMLVSNYKLPSRFDEEIPAKLKLLTYPSQIPKSTFASVGSPHSWPLLLAMLSWLCDIVSTVITTPVQEMAYPADFESAVNPNWQALTFYLEAMMDPDPQHQLKYLMMHKEMMEREWGVDDEGRRRLEEEVAQLRCEERQLKQDQSSLPQLQHFNAELKSDVEKLDVFNRNIKLKIDQLAIEKERVRQEGSDLESRKQGIKEKIESLSALKTSQNFTAEELLQIKNHAHTTAASLQQLQDQGKQTQEKIWAVEMKLCKDQVMRSELIQQYNASAVASLVGTIAAAHQPSHDYMDTSDSEDPTPDGGVVAPVQERDLQELSSKLTEELRVTRAKVVEALAGRSNMEEQCRHVEHQVEEKKLQVSQINRHISSLKEEINYSQQEKKTEEAAKLEELRAVQEEVGAARRAPKPQLHTRQQHLLTLSQQLEEEKQQLKRRVDEGSASVQLMCAKIDDLLQHEERLAQEFSDDIANTIANTGDRDAALGPKSAVL